MAAKTPRQKIARLYDENADESDRVLADLLISEAHDQMDIAQACEDFDDRITHYRAARSFLNEADYVLTRQTEDSRL